jgi:hypothetical protein
MAAEVHRLAKRRNEEARWIIPPGLDPGCDDGQDFRRRPQPPAPLEVNPPD